MLTETSVPKHIMQYSYLSMIWMTSSGVLEQTIEMESPGRQSILFCDHKETRNQTLTKTSFIRITDGKTNILFSEWHRSSKLTSSCYLCSYDLLVSITTKLTPTSSRISNVFFAASLDVSLLAETIFAIKMSQAADGSFRLFCQGSCSSFLGKSCHTSKTRLFNCDYIMNNVLLTNVTMSNCSVNLFHTYLAANHIEDFCNGDLF